MNDVSALEFLKQRLELASAEYQALAYLHSRLSLVTMYAGLPGGWMMRGMQEGESPQAYIARRIEDAFGDLTLLTAAGPAASEETWEMISSREELLDAWRKIARRWGDDEIG